ncbi:MAG: hypothetical protein NVS1B6_07880 [Steroidobacteraceae bacterium]
MRCRRRSEPRAPKSRAKSIERSLIACAGLKICCGVFKPGEQAGTRAADGQQNYLELLRAQRDDLDKAIALARNPQRKAY